MFKPLQKILINSPEAYEKRPLAQYCVSQAILMSDGIIGNDAAEEFLKTLDLNRLGLLYKLPISEAEKINFLVRIIKNFIENTDGNS